MSDKLFLPDEMTMGQAYVPCMTMTTIEQATEWLTALIERDMRCGYCQTIEEAKEVELSNIGYAAGYYDSDTRRLVNELFGAVHPVFGSNYNVTPEEAFKAGLEWGNPMITDPAADNGDRERETAGEDEEAVTDDERESIEQIVSQYEMGNRHTAFKLYKELYPDGYKDEESIQHSIEYMRRVIIAQNTEKQIADLKAENSALQRQLATAEGEIGRLRTALKPFAIQWDEFVKYVAEMGYILSDQEISFDDFHQDYLDGEVDADHYRQAASALEASQPKAAGGDRWNDGVVPCKLCQGAGYID